MILALIGLIVGIIVGIYVPLTIPITLARYSAVGLLGIVDAVFGASKAELQGRYSPIIFLSGLLFNMALAIAITYLGDRLGLDLYLAVLVVFTMRIFNNIAKIRYAFLTRFLGQKRVSEEISDDM